MKIHLIAIGGSVMHQLGIALKTQGHEVSGSDDLIFEPSKSRLAHHDLLPVYQGWNPDAIDQSLDMIVVGMHAKADNPELVKALELGIKTMSFPELVYDISKDSQRIVVAGSHGKTSITAMISHVIDSVDIEFNYMAGAPLVGGESAVKLEHDLPVMLIEGDEYPSSALDSSPKFLHYHHHIAVISGIAWDHANVYPTFEQYKDAFRDLIALSKRSGGIIYHEGDKQVRSLIKEANLASDVEAIPYTEHPSKIKDGITYLIDQEGGEVPLKIFGKHNLQNISAAFEVCQVLRVEPQQFYKAISTFSGAAMRLQLEGEKDGRRLFRDFAHAPSKVKATTDAVKKQFGKQLLVACMELHTYSSLNQVFIDQYKGTLASADEAIVYYDPEIVSNKKLPDLSEEVIRGAFAHKNLKVYATAKDLESDLTAKDWQNENLLLMSSGNFGGLDVENLKKGRFS